MVTEKKVKVIGTQQYINAQTGEIEEMQVTNIEERDFNFTKVWLSNFLLTLDIIGNQKIKIAEHIIDNLDKENRFIGTIRSIAKETNTAPQTVNLTLKALLDADFLRKVQTGVYIVNPNIVFKGSHGARLNVLNSYSETKKEEMSIDDKIKGLQTVIENAQKQITKLEFERTPKLVKDTEKECV